MGLRSGELPGLLMRVMWCLALNQAVTIFALWQGALSWRKCLVLWSPMNRSSFSCSSFRYRRPFIIFPWLRNSRSPHCRPAEAPLDNGLHGVLDGLLCEPGVESVWPTGILDWENFSPKCCSKWLSSENITFSTPQTPSLSTPWRLPASDPSSSGWGEASLLSSVRADSASPCRLSGSPAANSLQEGIFSLSCLPVQVGFFIKAFLLVCRAWGLSLRLWTTRYFLALMGLAGFFLAKLRVQWRELLEMLSWSLIFFIGTWTLDQLQPLSGPWRGVLELFPLSQPQWQMDQQNVIVQIGYLVVEQEKNVYNK